MSKLEQIQYSILDDEDKITVTLESYRDGVHLTVQDRNNKTISFSAKQTKEFADLLSKGLKEFEVKEKVAHTHNQYGGMIDCKGCEEERK